MGTLLKYTIRVHLKNGRTVELQSGHEPEVKYDSELRACVLKHYYNQPPFLFKMEDIEGYESEDNKPE